MDSQNSSSRYALDASAFYAGTPFLSSAVSYYCTTQAILDEVKHIKKSHGAIEALSAAGNLEIIDPGKSSIEKVKAAAKKTGDYRKLSQADVSIIALALQLETTLLTDDYAVANVASALKIPVKSSSGKGIKETRKWISYCSACGRAFGPEAKECPLCGNKLRRKYRVTS
ncbi:putative nucleotide binding protein [Candidatus Nitrososphaera gargensis Ga9.2]|uniref:Endoribonuclease Nob1 n=1 Tax=Nitrososphaera gargensis (strain Ga9.2) TaxID=1237085 RepID=K0INF9_NITGG|nr:nucleotide-binding protein [Candidatus Nitrososphaera gargensis]AFU59304.1 putative nucleotide binding protein [Candidatus Nitrososphaera gargensis Ga9.2]